jgi:hypothetical protein
MLKFNSNFANVPKEMRPTCVLLADEPTYGQVTFTINSEILVNVLLAANPVYGRGNEELCEKERPRIEKACQQAFSERPGTEVVLSRRDFAT